MMRQKVNIMRSLGETPNKAGGEKETKEKKRDLVFWEPRFPVT